MNQLTINFIIKQKLILELNNQINKFYFYKIYYKFFFRNLNLK